MVTVAFLPWILNASRSEKSSYISKEIHGRSLLMLHKFCVKNPANTSRETLVVSTGATGPMNSEQSSMILYINCSVAYLIRHDFGYIVDGLVMSGQPSRSPKD